MPQKLPASPYQRPQQQVTDPYYGDYSALAQLLSQSRTRPTFSVGQGIADATGDIVTAYFEKKAREAAEQKQAGDTQNLALAQQFAMRPGMTQQDANNMLGAPTPIDSQVFGQPAKPQERAAAAVSMLNPRNAVGAGTEIADIARQFAPPQGYTGKLGENERAFINGQQVAAGPDKPTPEKKGNWAMDLHTGKPVYKTDADLLNAPEGTYSKVPDGMRIVSDGQGGFEITTGGLEPSMTNPSKTKLEDTIISGRDALARLDGIQSKFKPEYQVLQNRWGNFVTAAKEKFGLKTSPEEQAQLNDFTAYRRDTVANLNQTIKDITGATVSEQEAPRLMQQMPVAGQGALDGDSPTEFMAKLNGTREALTAAVARAAYARANGLDKTKQFAIPLDTIPKLIEDKGNQYASQLKTQNPTAPEDQIKQMVKNRLREEFGLQ